jgi:hypothetical protein
MSLNRDRAQKYLQKFDFESLFIEELGWNRVDRVTLPFEIDGEPFEVVSIAQKRGFIVYQCITLEIPARSVRVKLDRQLTDYSKSHLLVFGDKGKRSQIWMWVRQELGKPLAPRFERYQVGQSAERLLQKLEALAIAFAEEKKLSHVEVASLIMVDSMLLLVIPLMLNSLKFIIENPSKHLSQNQQEIYTVRLSKPIIDEIDRVLAQHYSFNAEELDFIINYDIK